MANPKDPPRNPADTDKLGTRLSNQKHAYEYAMQDTKGVKMIERTMAQKLRDMSEWFPVVSLTGPRQSGKSTLIKAVFPEYEYLNLENPEVRRAALDDPVGFISRRPDHLIIDEAQYAPELFSMIQVASDECGRAGQYVLSGSQNFLLMHNIQQSLAGRVGMLKLLPLSYQELSDTQISLDTYLIRGGYPRIYDAGIPIDMFYQNYLMTYVERDAGGLLDVRNLSSFRKMIGLCAACVGGLLNLSRLAADVGVATATISSWLSILQSSYLVFLLQPYAGNMRKRLTKAPKLYFYDTGLLCHLLGIHDERSLINHPLSGEIFENLVVSERQKAYLNRGIEPTLVFYRDDSKREIDLIDLTEPARPQAFEIKSSATYRDTFARHLRSVGSELGIPAKDRAVVYHGSERYDTEGASVVPAEEFLLRES